jgi:cytoskeletal protein CcmA (bactofilin family)
VLTSSAHMCGDVIHQDIRIESGAFIDGHCRPEFGKSNNKTAFSVSKPVATPLGQAAQMKSSDTPRT